MNKNCRKQRLLFLLSPAYREEKKSPAGEGLSKTAKAKSAVRAWTCRLPSITVCSSCSPAARGSQRLERCLAWKLHVSVLNAFISAARPGPVCRGIIHPGSAAVCSCLLSSAGCTDGFGLCTSQQERSMNFPPAASAPDLAPSLTGTAFGVARSCLETGNSLRGSHSNSFSSYFLWVVLLWSHIKQFLSSEEKKVSVQGLTLRELHHNNRLRITVAISLSFI